MLRKVFSFCLYTGYVYFFKCKHLRSLIIISTLLNKKRLKKQQLDIDLIFTTPPSLMIGLKSYFIGTILFNYLRKKKNLNPYNIRFKRKNNNYN